MHYFAFFISSIFLLLAGCSSRTADIGGDFYGNSPCMNCEEIEIELNLDSSKTYTLKTTYVGSHEPTKTSKGIWFVDKENYILELVDDQQKYYIIYDDLLELTDKDGIRSEQGKNYRLEQ